MSEPCGSELLPASQDSSSAGLLDDGSCTNMASPGPCGDGNISEGSVSGASDFEDLRRRSRRHWTDARPTVDEVGQGITSLLALGPFLQDQDHLPIASLLPSHG